jgi:hypothetical protein
LGKISKEDQLKFRQRIVTWIDVQDHAVTVDEIVQGLNASGSEKPVLWQRVELQALKAAANGRIDAKETGNGFVFSKKPETVISGNGHRIAKSNGNGSGSVKPSHSGTEADMNQKIVSGLERAYGPDRAKEIIGQATDSFFYRNREATTSPELYELYSDGDIDAGIESLGLNRWVIGRFRSLE